MTLKLFEVLSRIESEEDFKAFFEDLCTYAEIEKMEQRVECAQLLLGGDTYNRIIEKTDISSATLSRVSRCLQYGSGGYSRVLKKIAEENARENGNAD
ncbi:MAG: YerC/YecD family TrpR-related protein [Christensenellales bacterium]|nr:YerC/YecD family TrpR-related protein [Christensenellales bacterium]